MVEKSNEDALLNDLNRYCASRVSDMTAQFTIASKNGNQEAIHELRVEIKRFRAFLELMRDTGLKFSFRKIFTPVKEIFKAAAVIRDTQVLQNLTREILTGSGQDLNVSEYINTLKQKEINGIRVFLKESKVFDLTILEKTCRMIGSKLSRKSETRMQKASEAYLEKLLSTLNYHRAKEALDENDYHNIRILCKKTRYTLEALSCCYERDDHDLLNENLRLIHQALGEWHDTDIASIFLRNLLDDPTIQPLFSASSYEIFSDRLSTRKKHYAELFLSRFRSLEFKSCSKTDNSAENPEDQVMASDKETTCKEAT